MSYAKRTAAIRASGASLGPGDAYGYGTGKFGAPTRVAADQFLRSGPGEPVDVDSVMHQLGIGCPAWQRIWPASERVRRILSASGAIHGLAGWTTEADHIRQEIDRHCGMPFEAADLSGVRGLGPSTPYTGPLSQPLSQGGTGGPVDRPLCFLAVFRSEADRQAWIAANPGCPIPPPWDGAGGAPVERPLHWVGEPGKTDPRTFAPKPSGWMYNRSGL